MKSLVIYFSHTGENYMENGIRNIEVGNTEKVANIIKNYTNADIFKVETVKEYPYNYYECCDVAKKELEQKELPEIKNKITDISNYDVIYIGGPVWWGHYPKAIDKALENIDFTNIIIKPFTTHEGSGLGETTNDIKRLCKNGIIKEGLAIRGCTVEDKKEEIERWCDK